MPNRPESARRVRFKYALIAACLGVLSVLCLEAGGRALSSSYSGLGGKLDAPGRIAPAVAPFTR